MPLVRIRLARLVVAGAVKVPLVIVNVPFAVRAVVLPPTARAFADLATVIALNVWLAAVPLIFWSALVLLKVTMSVPGVNAPPMFTVQSPLAVMP